MAEQSTILLGDCVEVMRTLDDNSVDSIVTDVPYELGFMGKTWDSTGIAYSVPMWSECLRVLKPGGHLLTFTGTRTYHRITCAIEDAGFEVRDRIRFECSPASKYGPLWDSLSDGQRRALFELLNDQVGLGSELAWTYGSGFPKSKNLDGEWEGWGTALKPAHEPICVARKPLAGTVAANVLAFGTGALNIDACRVPTDEKLRAGAGGIPCRHDENAPRGRAGEASAERRYTEEGGTNFAMRPGPRGGDPVGRWPANVIHDGSDAVVSLFPHSTSGAMKSGTMRAAQDSPGSVCYGTYGGNITTADIAASSGTAARFFYCAKATRADRNEGCDELPSRAGGMNSNTSGQHITRRDGWVPQPVRNNHPTVKPTALMAYLCRLVTPPGGVVLDPFMGSGSTGKAAIQEGFRFIGIDMTPEYVEIARARIAHAQSRRCATKAEQSRQRDLFAEVAA